MKIKILAFKVVETYTIIDTWYGLWNRIQEKHFWTKLWMWIITPADRDEYHFDVVIKIDDQSSLPRRFKENDFIELDNKVKLVIWSVDRMDIIRAKTYKFTTEDLRRYKPKEMYLCYSNQHGHLNDRTG